MSRLNKDQLNKIKQAYNVDRIWSFSRLSTWENCPMEYYQKYYLHKHLDSGNVYTEFGGVAHDLAEGYLDGSIPKDMVFDKWSNAVNTWKHDPNAYQFDTEKIKMGYIDNLNYYFRRLGQEGEDLTGVVKIVNEKPVMVRLGGDKYIFVGYIDTLVKDDAGGVVLIDYKTSSKSSFSKAKLPEKSMQLMLYAIGIHQQMGIPYEKIEARFQMMKYCVVWYQQENGKWRSSVQEWRNWVSKMSKKLATKLKKGGWPKDEADALIAEAALKNNLDNMPDDIQEAFHVGDYYIELPVCERECEEVAQRVVGLCDKIVDFEKQPEVEQELWLETNARYDPNNYYETHLCSWHTSDEFKQMEGIKDKKQDDQLDDLFAEDSVGIDALFG